MFIPHIRGSLGDFALKTGYSVDNFFIICVRQIAQRKFYPPNSASLCPNPLRNGQIRTAALQK